MAEGTYEFECMRSELLGIEKPEQEEFEKARAERLKAEQEELEASEANLLDNQEETLQNTGGKLDELNSILSSTQVKLNRFKQSARGSLTNMFSKNSVDDSNVAAEKPSSSSSSRRNTTAGSVGEGGDINAALENLDEMQQKEEDEIKPQIPYLRNASLDIQKKMTSHLDKLDALINKADRAEASMQSQTKQMKKISK